MARKQKVHWKPLPGQALAHFVGEETEAPKRGAGREELGAGVRDGHAGFCLCFGK